MLPQFFDMIGIDAQGQTFELVFWSLILVAGIVVLIREYKASRPVGDAWYGYAIGGGLAFFSALFLFKLIANNELYFDEDGLNVSNYGLAIAFSFIIGIYLAVREASRSPAPPEVGHLFDLSFWILVFGMVGARVLFIIVGWRDYANLCFAPELVEGVSRDATGAAVSDCFAVLKFWKGGLVFFGGFVGAALAGWFYCRKHKIRFLRAADVVIPSLALGHFFGRLGCLAAGCCFGQPTKVPWGVVMPTGSAPFHSQLEALRAAEPPNPQAWIDLLAQGHSHAIHATQLYEASAELIFFIYLLFLRSKKRFHGQVIATWLILYSCMRFLVEFYRGDKIRGFLFELPIPPINRLLGLAESESTILSTSQAIGLATVALGVAIFVRQRRKSKDLSP